MKPMIILPVGLIDAQGIKILRENGICVVVAKDPAKVRFVDPIPAASQRTTIENAAIHLSRLLLNGQWGDYTNTNYVDRSTITRIYCDLLMQGTPLDRNGTQEEQDRRRYDQAHADELCRLARADAKAAHEAKKAAKAAAANPPAITAKQS